MWLKEKYKLNKERFFKTAKELLTQGATPEKLGITVMLGVIFGMIPVLGVNTVILVLIALKWRLNMIIIQIINYTIYPLQLIFLIPFYKAGQWVFKTEDSINFTASEFARLFSTDFLKAISEFSFIILKGISVWLLISIPIGILIYYVFLMFFRNLLIQVVVEKKG